MFAVSDIWNIENENREASKPFEQKLESRLSNIENIKNEKSQIRQIPIKKSQLYDFGFWISEIGYCVSEIEKPKFERKKTSLFKVHLRK